MAQLLAYIPATFVSTGNHFCSLRFICSVILALIRYMNILKKEQMHHSVEMYFFYTVTSDMFVHSFGHLHWMYDNLLSLSILFPYIIEVDSLARGPKLLSMYAVEQRGFLVRKYWLTGSSKTCQTAFRMEFGERRAPSKCCIQKLVKKLETRGSRSNACRRLSLGPIEGQSVQKYTLHNRTTQRRYTPRDSSRERRHFGKSIPEFGETHWSVLGCEGRSVSASIMSRSCFASFPVCVYKFSSHYLNNITFYRQ